MIIGYWCRSSISRWQRNIAQQCARGSWSLPLADIRRISYFESRRHSLYVVRSLLQKAVRPKTTAWQLWQICRCKISLQMAVQTNTLWQCSVRAAGCGQCLCQLIKGLKLVTCLPTRLLITLWCSQSFREMALEKFLPHFHLICLSIRASHPILWRTPDLTISSEFILLLTLRNNLGFHFPS